TALFGTAAFAGTGVGSILNIGRYNAANATTELAGTTNGKQLYIVNASNGANATGIGVVVHSGKPPLSVNSSTKVANLNAGLRDGASAAAFQKRVAGSCTDRRAVTSINADGTVGCSAFTVYPIHHSVGAGGEASDAFGSSGLVLISRCLNPATGSI